MEPQRIRESKSVSYSDVLSFLSPSLVIISSQLPTLDLSQSIKINGKRPRGLLFLRFLLVFCVVFALYDFGLFDIGLLMFKIFFLRLFRCVFFIGFAFSIFFILIFFFFFFNLAFCFQFFRFFFKNEIVWIMIIIF